MKTVLITGAYRGLGYEVARQLSERGWKVILTARRSGQGSAAAAKLKNTSFLELDITDDRSVAQAAKAVASLDVLVNNGCRTEMGGSGAPRSVEEGAAGIVWLAADAPQDKTGLFWRDREVLPW